MAKEEINLSDLEKLVDILKKQPDGKLHIEDAERKLGGRTRLKFYGLVEKAYNLGIINIVKIKGIVVRTISLHKRN